MTIPLYTRSSDIRTIGLHLGCEASSVLSWLYDEPEPVWFPRGTAIHTAIEHACLDDTMEREQMIQLGLRVFGELAGTAVSMGKHTYESSLNDIERMLSRWWSDVHPSSPKRAKIWEQYYWPPVLVEHDIKLSDVGLYTQVDAVFEADDHTVIVDWKSSGQPKADKEQIQTYVYGGRKEGWFPEEQQGRFGFFWFLDHSQAVHVDSYPGDDVVEWWIDETREHKVRLVESGAPRYAQSWWCDYCQSQNICPVFGENGKSFEDVALAISKATLREAPEVQR